MLNGIFTLHRLLTMTSNVAFSRFELLPDVAMCGLYYFVIYFKTQFVFGARLTFEDYAMIGVQVLSH